MKHIAFVLGLGLVVGACSVGGDDETGGGPEGGVDDRDDTLGIVCNATFKLAGSFTAGTPARPADSPTVTANAAGAADAPATPDPGAADPAGSALPSE